MSAGGLDPAPAPTTTVEAAPIPVRDLLARNLRRLRGDGVASHDDISRAARAHGLAWTASWLAAVERGQRQLTAEQLVALPFVLTDVLGHRVSLADLLLADEPVLLARADDVPHAPLSASYLREVLTAAPYRRPFAAPPENGAGLPAESASQRAAEKMREIGRAGLGDVDVRALARAEAGATEVEERLARKLGVPAIVLIAAAAGLWGRSLSEERDARLAPEPPADPGTPEPRPAAVMRRLTGQIAARLTEAERAAGEETGALVPEARAEPDTGARG